MKRISTWAAVVAVFSLSVSEAAPAEPMIASRGELLFPEPGHVALMAASGIPFLAVGEVAIGVTNRFSVGALAGFTPQESGFGTRIRGVLIERGAWRLSAVAPVLVYPRIDPGLGAPWTLVRPMALFERRFNSGWRASFGLGFVGAATFARLARTFGAADFSDGAGGVHAYGIESPITAGIWGTLSAGLSMPLSPRWSLFLDAGVVTEGTRLAGSSWIGGPPIIVALGTCVSL